MTAPGPTPREFDLLRGLVHRQIGVYLSDSKRALLEARLRGRLRALGLPTFMSYYERLAGGEPDPAELQRLVDAITTNTTSFFREPVQFEFLARELVPAWVRRRAGAAPRVRVWSAACSTGQEPYSLAAVLSAGLPEAARADTKVLATDISERALDEARIGRYPARVAGEIPSAWRGAFVRSGTGSAARIVVSPEVRSLVVFRALNLIATSYPFQRRFDAIFCRNVLIYFDQGTRLSLVERLARQLAPGGHLFLGLSEALVQIPGALRPLGDSIYRADGAG